MDTFTVGKIVNTHGLKGELRILPSTDDNNRFKKLDSIFIENKKGLNQYDIEEVRFHKNFVLLKLKDINTIEEGEIFKNCLIKIDKKNALPLDKNEYYISDLYDLKVQTEDGRMLGIIDDILFSSANDVYVIKRADNPKPLLIPAIKNCILNVDIENKIMTVKLLEGLEEI
ncbi:16S rRNA processing protein RimM [Candidatus Epulonipiscioides gigas]|nr:16S rRNA processing protein RimM [Epulopiscium sp. SCG-C07WGA-EpuloA2]